MNRKITAAFASVLVMLGSSVAFATSAQAIAYWNGK